ncbi:MAG TPA: ribosome silencing factor [Acidobacteriaceae bacterium]|jgi:ribosome-associated protein|nr:ribosome silencing factor [Acidobacteriaceae bacterium]
MATPETRRQLLAAVAACDDKKGEDTRILELDPADSGLADFFLITSATNDRQVVAIADEIEFRLKKDFGLYATSVEGRRQAEWILLDYVDIVIHVFLQEKRAFYDIERLRKSARPLTSAEVEAELKAELAQKTRAVRGTASSSSKKAVKAGKSPATRAQKPKTPSAKTSLPKTPIKGESNLTAKPAKKAAKKTALKSSFKPGKELKAAPKTAVKKTAAKPALKSAKKAATIPAKGMTSKMAVPTEGTNVLGAKPPIVKQSRPAAVLPKEPKPPVLSPEPPADPSILSSISGAVVGARPPIVKRALPAAPISVTASAVPVLKRTAKAPLKQAVKKSSKGK